MASTYSTDLKLELMVTGEKAGLWGDITNSNLVILNNAIAGYTTVNVGSTDAVTLAFTNGVTSNGKNAVLDISGTPSADCNVIIPDGIEKTYIVDNSTGGTSTVTIKTATGSGFTFGDNEKTKAIVYSDGTNVNEVINVTQQLQDVADLAVTDGNFIVGDGTNFVAESGATARTSLGVGTGDDVQFDSFGVGTAASGTTGEIRATNDVTAFYSSDIALKEDIVNIPNPLEAIINIPNPLEAIKKLNGVTFNWKKSYIDERGGEDGYFVRKKDVGVIAQEVEKVLPEAVAQRPDGIKAVKYDRLTCLLIEAVKHLQDKVDSLTKKGD